MVRAPGAAWRARCFACAGALLALGACRSPSRPRPAAELPPEGGAPAGAEILGSTLAPVRQPDGSAARAALVSGIYEDLILGVDLDHRTVTGYFASATGQSRSGEPLFSCRFFLRGVLGEDGAALATWFPADRSETIRGRLTVLPEGEILVALEREHGGCWNVRHFADPEPAAFSLGTAGDWTSVRIVAAARAHFFASPDPASVQKPYAVQGDAILVLAASPGWIRGRLGTTEGWLHEQDLYGDRVPSSGAAVDAGAEPHPCEPDLVWDTAARECRMYPDGPYGWTGCSLARQPPGGRSCVTGAHWGSCTCTCDRGLRFDPRVNACR